jgi:hypothetical protein
LRDGLAVGHLRTPDVRLDAELAAQPVHDDLEVELAHPLDDRLVRLGIGVDAEGRVLLGQLLTSPFGELVLVRLGLRLDRDRDHRLGNFMLSRTIGWSDRRGCPRPDVLQPDRGRDVAGVDLVPLLPLVRVHLEEAPDALRFPSSR